MTGVEGVCPTPTRPYSVTPPRPGGYRNRITVPCTPRAAPKGPLQRSPGRSPGVTPTPRRYRNRISVPCTLRGASQAPISEAPYGACCLEPVRKGSRIETALKQGMEGEAVVSRVQDKEHETRQE